MHLIGFQKHMYMCVNKDASGEVGLEDGRK